MPRVPKEYAIVLEEHRRRLARLAERRGAAELRKLYKSAQGELERKLSYAMRRNMGDTFTAQHMRIMLGQVKQGVAQLSGRMAGQLGGLSREAQEAALGSLVEDVGRLERKFTGIRSVLPIEEASRFAGIIDKRRTSLLNMHRTSMARYGAETVGAVEERLALSLVTGESTGDAIDAVQDAIDGEWYQAERIVRTEQAWAYSAATADGLKEAREELPDLEMRWTEYVSDDGEPLDDRVGIDSIALHGQLAVRGMFTVPPMTEDGQIVPAGLVGKRKPFPPMRPNDRAVLLPWRPDWGIPAWRWINEQRVDAE